MSALYLGADPGATGALVAIDDRGSWVDSIRLGKRTWADVLVWLGAKTHRTEMYCTLEKVGASPQMGRTSAFNFGASYGRLQVALLASGVSVAEVSPAKWQRLMGVPRAKGKGQPAHKRVLRGIAEARFPGRVKTADLADAALLAEFCRQVRG